MTPRFGMPLQRAALALTAVVLATPISAADLEIHGSNTVGASLAPLLVGGYLETRGEGPVTVTETGPRERAPGPGPG